MLLIRDQESESQRNGLKLYAGVITPVHSYWHETALLRFYGVVTETAYATTGPQHGDADGFCYCRAGTHAVVLGRRFYSLSCAPGRGMHEPVNAIDCLDQRFWHRRLTTQDEVNTVQVCARLPFHTALTAT